MLNRDQNLIVPAAYSPKCLGHNAWTPSQYTYLKQACFIISQTYSSESHPMLEQLESVKLMPLQVNDISAIERQKGLRKIKPLGLVSSKTPNTVSLNVPMITEFESCFMALSHLVHELVHSRQFTDKQSKVYLPNLIQQTKNAPKNVINSIITNLIELDACGQQLEILRNISGLADRLNMNQLFKVGLTWEIARTRRSLVYQKTIKDFYIPAILSTIKNPELEPFLKGLCFNNPDVSNKFRLFLEADNNFSSLSLEDDFKLKALFVSLLESFRGFRSAIKKHCKISSINTHLSEMAKAISAGEKLIKEFETAEQSFLEKRGLFRQVFTAQNPDLNFDQAEQNIFIR